MDTSPVLSTGFSGLVLYDLTNGKELLSRNKSKHFIPASNIKLFTLFACLKTLGDSIPALKYIETDSTFTFWGTCDATFLHPKFPNSKVLDFIQSKAKSKKLIYSYGHSTINHYGKGWMWDDYNDYYQTELTPFPMFGNALHVCKDSNGLSLYPISSKIVINFGAKPNDFKRNLSDNLFTLPLMTDSLMFSEKEIPFKDVASLNILFLEDTLKTKISIEKSHLPKEAKTFYSTPVDTVYKRMMQVSDNMLAEHLLLSCGLVISDTISSKYAIDTIKKLYFSEMITTFNWVDGSGLSRYNLFSPDEMIFLLKKMYSSFPKDRLFSLLTIGKEGRLKNMDLDNGKPFVFAKSGSMNGVYNLSGYLNTRSGRCIAFSFLNNQFNGPVYLAKKEVERILIAVHQSL
ncbi:MAG: D-alanyl-D-alanine carboxypeptidase [Saprospiraceae bacterium]|nr:D-alanyl-D-alanine carboxypeptidase [Saprospiraceae bacterium]